ncbi:hypothetical protein WKW79_29035 [Variovorax robiniae]|uniref:Uncharacterized protein n=1 Tax=Variovorax robiniae TaxID=1836199 RepID=A0ABU8XHU1_9BURK
MSSAHHPAPIDLSMLASDPELLLDELDRALDELPMTALPAGVLSGQKDEDGAEGRYREVREGRPWHATVEALLRARMEPLKQAVCEKGGYCALKRRHQSTVDVAKAVGDSLLSLVIKIPLPVATLSLYCVQSLFLDRLCDCDGSP